MKIKFTLVLLWLMSLTFSASAQKTEKFDIITFENPTGWQKEVKQNAVQLVAADSNGGICLTTMFKSVDGSNDSKVNFNLAWEAIVKGIVKVKSAPRMNPVGIENGWTFESGLSQYENDGQNGVALLITATGNSKMVNILILTNSDAFAKNIDQFIGSVHLQKIAGNAPSVESSSNNSTKGSFDRNIFNDGWVSLAKDDWVEVSRGNFKVLLHYPNNKVDLTYGTSEQQAANAWNIMVSARYSNLQNFYSYSGASFEYNKAIYITGNVTERQTGKQVFVVLYKGKQMPWIEIISPSKNAFLQGFPVDESQLTLHGSSETVHNSLAFLINYNKFPISENDLQGKWSDRYSSNTFWANVQTGEYAGVSTYTSSEVFEFGVNNTYKWRLIAANTYGRTTVGIGNGTGVFKILNNGQIYFSNIEGKPKTYDVYCSYIKGAKIIFMGNTKNPSGSYTGFGKYN